MRRLRPLLPTAALAALLAAANYRVLFLGEAYVLRDALRFTLPSRQALAEALRAGRIPEWLDAVGFGVPFAANPIHGALAPLGWTLAFLPPGSGLYTFLHLVLAAAGAAAFSRRLGASAAGGLFAGLSLACCGYTASVVANGMAPILAWTPWVAWAADRLARPEGEPVSGRRRLADLLVLAAALAFQLLCGEPASVLLTGLVALAVVLARAPRRRESVVGLGLAVGVSLFLAAVALVPAFSLVGASSRAGGLPASLGEHWSMHPLRLLEWFWPLAYGAPGGEGWLARVLIADGGGEPCWASSLAVGAPVLLLSAAAPGRDRRWLLAGSFCFVLLAFGRHGLVYSLYRFLFPPEQLARYPEKYLYGALVLWSALAGVSFTELVERGGAGRRLRLAAWSSGTGLGAAVALLWLARAPAAAWLAVQATAAGIPLDPSVGLELALRGGALATAGALLFALALQLREARPSWRSAPLLAAAGALLPLVLATWSSTPLAHREVVARQPALLAAIPRPPPSALAPLPRLLRGPQTVEQTRFDGGDDLAASFEETLAADVPARFGVAALPGFDPASSPRFDRLWAQLFQRMSWEGLTGLLGVDYLAVEEAQVPQTGLAPAGSSVRGWSILPVRAKRPRAFVAPRWRVAQTADAAVADLATPGREDDLGAVTVLAADAPPGPAAPWPLSPCQVERRSPEEQLLRCDSPSGGVAVLLEELAPGWRAEVDGRDAPILLADGLFRAATVGPGPHEVRFHYRTPGLRAGAGISLVAWLALIAIILSLPHPFSSLSPLGGEGRGEGAEDKVRENDR